MDLATKRARVELKRFFHRLSTGEGNSSSSESSFFFFPDESNILHGHVLIIGPDGTPYEKGLFLFEYNLPNMYPHEPPKVQLLTTGGGGKTTRVRFGPNFYASGKVCLSILGTWDGPGWTQAFTLESVFVSIQSLMSEEPYYNEPGFSKLGRGMFLSREATEYTEVIRYYTLQIAVCEAADQATQYESDLIRDMIRFLFLKHYQAYRDLIVDKASTPELAGRELYDYHGIGKPKVVLDYDDLLCRLDTIQEWLLADEKKNGTYEERVKLYYSQCNAI